MGVLCCWLCCQIDCCATFCRFLSVFIAGFTKLSAFHGAIAPLTERKFEKCEIASSLTAPSSAEVGEDVVTSRAGGVGSSSKHQSSCCGSAVPSGGVCQ